MLEITPLRPDDPLVFEAAFAAQGWNKSAAQFEKYFAEQEAGVRPVLVARWDGAFAGYLTVMWRSHYPPFREQGIPEISDFNVLMNYQRRRIGTALMDRAEALIATRCDVAGIGVGMDRDYGAAQRLYVLRGYVPDGRGMIWNDLQVQQMQSVVVDEELVLYSTKRVRGGVQ